MEKIKKVYNLRIIAVFVALVFSLNAKAYGIEVPNKTNLRIPLITVAREVSALDGIYKKHERNLTGVLLDETALSEEYGLKACMLAKAETVAGIRNMVPSAAALRLKDSEKGFSSEDLFFLKSIVKLIEDQTKHKFGKDLLLAIRSSPVQSKPGVFSTALYVGFTQDTLDYYASIGQSEFGFETYVYFMQSYVKAVIGKDESDLLEIFQPRNAADTWEKHAKRCRELLESKYHINIPLDSYEQLAAAITAVQNRMHQNEMEGGVLLMEMAYPHRDMKSGSGVLLTVDLKTGEDKISGRFGYKTQGPDIVTGEQGILLDQEFPYLRELYDIIRPLERIFKSVLYLEFVVEEGRVRLLQVRAMNTLGIKYQLPVWWRLHYKEAMTDAEILQAMVHAVNSERDTDSEGILLEYTRGMKFPEDKPVILYTESLGEKDVLRWISEGKLTGVVTPQENDYHHAAISALTTDTPIFLNFQQRIETMKNKAVVMALKTKQLRLFTGGSLQLQTRKALRNERLQFLYNEVLSKIEDLDLEETAKLHAEYIKQAIWEIKWAFRVAKNKEEQEHALERAAAYNLRAYFAHQIMKEREQQGIYQIVLYSKEINILRDDPEKVQGKILQQVENSNEIKHLRELYGDALQIRVITHSQLYGGRDIEQWNTRYCTFLRVQAYIKQKGAILFSKKFKVDLGSDSKLDENEVERLPLDDAMQTSLASAKTIQRNNPGAILSNYVTIDNIHDGGIIRYSRMINVIKFKDRGQRETPTYQLLNNVKPGINESL